MSLVAATEATAATACPVTPPSRAQEVGYPCTTGEGGCESTAEHRREESSPLKSFAKTDGRILDNAKACTKSPEVVETSDCETRSADLCLDQWEWLNAASDKYGLSSPSDVLARLIDQANGEPPKVKRMLFLVVRCRRCLQHSRGGDKFDHQFSLSSLHWQWLAGVCARCHHSSVAKTLRIILDFYMPLCKGDADFEQALVTRRVPDAAAQGTSATG